MGQRAEGVVYHEFRNIFNTVSHSVLVSKLGHYGLDG